MTICIAAIAEYKYIVTASDTKITTGHYSQELGALKMRKLHKCWRALISGKFSQYHSVYWPIVRAMFDHKKDLPTVEKMEEVCTNAYIAAHKKLAEQGILASYGLTLEQFLKSRQELGDSLYEQVWSEIKKAKVGCDLLVVGFDEVAFPTLFIVTNPTEDHLSFITHCDDPGFGVIGSGAYLTESTLYALEHSGSDSLAETICKVSFAKFASESASDVGEMTWLLVLDAQGNEFIAQAELLYDLREKWESNGKPKMPTDAIEHISKQTDAFTKPKLLTSEKSKPEP